MQWLNVFPNFLSICVLIPIIGYTSGTFEPSEMDEGGCVYFKKVKRLNTKWISEQSKKGWYFPMLSRKNANAWKEILTGSPLTSEDELANMCLRIYVEGPVITATGFGTMKAVWNCSKRVLDPNNDNGVTYEEKECSATQESSFPEYAAKAGDSSMAIAWTDNSEYLLSVRCLQGNRIWALIASVPVVQERIKVVIFERITKLGFDPQKALTLNYTGC